MLGKQDLYQLAGATAYDRDGDKIGSVGTVFVDNETDEGTFALVKTGLFGTRSSFVPLTDANFRDGDLHVAYPADQVKDAPNLDVDEELDREQELELYRYYGIPAVDADASPAATADAATADAPDAAGTAGTRPSGADLVADQGIDPMFDGPQVSAAERLRLRRLGNPASSADDALLEDGDERA
ncbi:MAG: PRC-barrel domain-containing protein [Egicoccus sp.]